MMAGLHCNKIEGCVHSVVDYMKIPASAWPIMMPCMIICLHVGFYFGQIPGGAPAIRRFALVIGA